MCVTILEKEHLIHSKSVLLFGREKNPHLNLHNALLNDMCVYTENILIKHRC